MPERRRSQRFELRLPVAILRDGAWIPAGETRNISARGFLMVSDTELPLDEWCDFTIDILADPQARVRVRCLGRVLRCSTQAAPCEIAATIERRGIARLSARAEHAAGEGRVFESGSEPAPSWG